MRNGYVWRTTIQHMAQLVNHIFPSQFCFIYDPCLFLFRHCVFGLRVHCSSVWTRFRRAALHIRTRASSEQHMHGIYIILYKKQWRRCCCYLFGLWSRLVLMLHIRRWRGAWDSSSQYKYKMRGLSEQDMALYLHYLMFYTFSTHSSFGFIIAVWAQEAGIIRAAHGIVFTLSYVLHFLYPFFFRLSSCGDVFVRRRLRRKQHSVHAIQFNSVHAIQQFTVHTQHS